MPAPQPDIAFAQRLFAELRERTGSAAGITRASYGPGEATAHAMVRREAEALGLAIATDAASNLYMTLQGSAQGAATMIGSHLDSVPAGGNFDGAAGVLMGLSVVAGYRAAGRTPPNDVTVMAIRAEESTWFNASYIGSRAAFGRLGADELAGVTCAVTGRRLGAAMASADGDPDALAGTPFLDPQAIGVFVEPHIEQGPVLDNAGLPFGIVTGIRGSFRYREAVCLGRYAHSGATPSDLRRDAVLAAAELVVALEAMRARLAADGHDIVATVGRFTTDPAEHAFSKVAGRTDLSIDVRSRSAETLAAMRAGLEAIAAKIAAERRVEIELGPLTGTAPALMDTACVDHFASLAATAGVEAPRMACGAGHDAAVFAGMGVPTAMLLVRNANGSHNPHEAMAMDDFATTARVLSAFCLDPPRRPA